MGQKKYHHLLMSVVNKEEISWTHLKLLKNPYDSKYGEALP